MPAGRPSLTERSAFGARLHGIRLRKGLAQKQVAAALGITQQSYAAWERRPVALNPARLAALAGILECSVDDLLGLAPKPAKRGGPVGKARRAFEELSRLPRSRQRKIVEVVEALLAQEAKAS